MRRFAAVAVREVAERRSVLVAAAAAAVLPFLVPLLPGVPSDQGEAARSLTALVLACALGLGGSILVGASVVGRELAERRLSFHFARPLSAPVIWGGKVVGGLALVLLSELVVLLPASAASGGFPGLPELGLEPAGLWALPLCAVPLFLAAWVGSVSIRSRSPWLVVDLVLLVSLLALLFVVGRRLARYGYGIGPDELLIGIGILLGSLLTATLAQVAAGRTDARRGHGAQSVTLWSLLLVATAAWSAWGERVIDPEVANLVRATAETAGPGGDWVLIEGSARSSGRGRTVYFANLSTAASFLVPFGWTGVVSADGSRAAYVAVSPFATKQVSAWVEVIDLKGGGTVVLDLGEWPEGIALSADGRRMAVVGQGICKVLEVPSLRSLASARVPSPRWAYEPHFVTPDLVRLHPRRSFRMAPDRSTRIPVALEDPSAIELHVGRKAITTLATYPISSIPVRPGTVDEPVSGIAFHLLLSPDLSRVLAMGLGGAKSALLLDAASGRVLASVGGGKETGHPIGVFLADGRAVISEPLPDGRRLVLLSPDGMRQAEIPLPAGTKVVSFGHEPAKGLLAIGLTRRTSTENREWHLADLGTGRLRPLEAEALPRGYWHETASVPPPGSPATRLALEKRTGRLVLLDPVTGERRALTRGRPAGK